MEAQPPDMPGVAPELIDECVLIVQDVLGSGAPIDDEAWEHDVRELLLRLGPVWDRRATA